jgi:ABC-type Na+ efflux pump permease subunit
MTVIATKLKSAEEASILQGPVYIFLLILYYVALSQNTIPRLSQGFGKIASYVPISSMLFMPMRLLSLKLGAGEILLSGCVAITSLLTLLFAGQRIYEKGLRHEKIFKKCIVKNRAK